MANLRRKVKQMNNEKSQNSGEKVQRWLHDSYNGSNDDIHSTKSFGIVHQTSKNSTETSEINCCWNAAKLCECC
jgi:arginine decarboxylase-like protein